MVRKPFEQHEYNECDQPAINAIKTFLLSKGSTVYNKDAEDYKVDIHAKTLDGIYTYHEVEIKKGWDTSNGWPSWWKDIQVPERKGHFNKPHHFIWVLSKDLSETWCIPGYQLTEDKLQEIPNKKISSGERFFKIPVYLCLRYKL